MLFGRRNPLSLLKRLRSAIWPRSGWKRSARYAVHRLGRLPATPYRIAAGFASGSAVSFTPLMGLHFVSAALLAFVVRGNFLASALGTLVGNPWTFPFIWAWTFAFGRWLIGHTREIEPLPEHLSLGYILDHLDEVFLPMLVGSIPTAIAAWFVTYFIVYRIVHGYQRARRLRLLRGRRRRAKLSRFHRKPQAPPAKGQRF